MLSARVSHGYFETFRIPLIAGRDFDPQRDTPASPRVVIVNQTLASMYGGQAVGKRFTREATTTDPPTQFEIVGVVADSKYLSLRQGAEPVVYSAMSQDPRPSRAAMIAVRSPLEAQAVTGSIVQSFRELDPRIGLSFTFIDTLLDQTLSRERLMATLSSFFGSVATALVVVGLYGLFAYTVMRRTNEIGVRMALGASRRDIVGMVLGEVARLVTVGVAIGVGLALMSGQLVATLLYGLEPQDPMSLGAAALLLGFVALLAGYLPANRASRIEPTTALRME